MPDTLAEWQRLFDAPDLASPARETILQSWSRSRAAGLDPADPKYRLHRVSDAELEARLQENAALVAAAGPHLDWISRAVAAAHHVVYIVDRDGIVLEARGNDVRMMSEYGLLPGYDWSEARMGTNGAGTALKAGKPVAVFGEDHFLRPFKGFTCVAAPIRDASGRVTGVIDLSTSVMEGRPQNLLLVAHTAFAIQRELGHS